MQTNSITFCELGTILERLTVTTSTYAGVFHIVSGRHPALGRVTVIQGISDIILITEEMLPDTHLTQAEVFVKDASEPAAMRQAA